MTDQVGDYRLRGTRIAVRANTIESVDLDNFASKACMERLANNLYVPATHGIARKTLIAKGTKVDPKAPIGAVVLLNLDHKPLASGDPLPEGVSIYDESAVLAYLDVREMTETTHG